MSKVSLIMNTKLTQRDRIASLISGTDPEHISPRYLYLWSSLVRLFYEGFPLTPAQISVLEETNRYSSKTRSACRCTRQYSFEACAEKFFYEAKTR